MTRRNQYGYSDTSECYRIINGERYIGWLVYASDKRKAAYKAVGLKFRTINGDELFLREKDKDVAQVIDAKMGDA